MDDLLREFLTETNESLDVVDVELVKFEQEPNNATILDNIFRLVHTIKGTCGFLGLPRLEAIAHAAETLMGKFRDGVPVTHEAVTLVLASIDRIKDILADLEAANGTEPEGADRDLIDELERLSLSADNDDMADEMAAAMAEEKAAEEEVGTDIYQVLERPLRPGEVSLDELERAFQEAEVEIEMPDPAEDAEDEAEAMDAAPEAAPQAEAPVAKKAEAKPKNPSAKGKASSQGVSNQSIRVNVETLEHLMTMVSELVLTRNQLLEIVRRHEDSEFKVPLQRLSNVTGELQEGVMKTRMQPIGNAWQKLPRIVRDLSQELDKPIGLEMIGAETELDRQVLELIKDPLTHMIRNSADHGLEEPADRVAAGKPEKGNITLSAYHEGGHIIIEVKDDGRGLNLEKIKEKALKNGVTTEAELEKMADQQIYKFIFAAGFSTATNVTSVSGRGVGMDVVRNNVELIGGSIDLRSTPGKGSSFIIKIPLTLAIVSTLIVEAGGDRYAIPQLSVVELVRVQSNSEHRIERLKDRPVLRLRNKLLPLVHMSQLLGQTEEADLDEDNGFIVVMQVGSQTFGVVVDGVFHTEEIVVKPMSSMLRNINMFSGNTILGDGSVIMIIDPNGVASAMASHASGTLTDTFEDEQDNEEARVIDADAPISLLLFRAGSEEPKAVPLSLVTRLEEFDVSKIEHSNGRDLVQYRGSLMPLVYVNEGDRHKPEGTQPMLVFSDNGRSMGLVVDQIVDIVEDRMTIEVVSERQGVLGSAIIRERATEVIDLGYYLPLAFDDWFMRKEIDTTTKVRKLLFLDDSAFFRNMLTPVLKAAGYDVTVCSSAQSAYELMEKGTDFAAIVTDIEMPDISGYEFCESLRRDTRFRHLPIIALSAVVTPASIEKGRQAGFDDYVAKFDRPGLLAALKDVLTSEMGVAA
ncbi:Chemotaxis protein CheA [Pseudovibrio sp. FO-BEG1]|uniref:Chemotaxis protein CheA n=1 Tax=Pseudovibrio denitrificans TaxID=258256 RepID=A0A1I7DK49_9HYPH|nr:MULTISPECIES: hybrid sensor histidine kinase/response regulator [Pseudovibrio]AEV39155.1 Chemotaxis protein CheA [Pseudovibrio sp. FO-BEG1]EEA92873.1 CheW-like domain protein [Pseudovibrio sp. JE062]SFU12006.1 two-component system, chemotaxis family, sensor kinase CheA [Pseudovibrio denitrificans]